MCDLLVDAVDSLSSGRQDLCGAIGEGMGDDERAEMPDDDSDDEGDDDLHG